jgi:hypothetical protein
MKTVFPRLVLFLLGACGLGACSESNESSVSADYQSIRVRQITLSDKAGKPIVTLSASSGANGAPLLVVRDPRGATLRTIELTVEK